MSFLDNIKNYILKSSGKYNFYKNNYERLLIENENLKKSNKIHEKNELKYEKNELKYEKIIINQDNIMNKLIEIHKKTENNNKIMDNLNNSLPDNLTNSFNKKLNIKFNENEKQISTIIQNQNNIINNLQKINKIYSEIDKLKKQIEIFQLNNMKNNEIQESEIIELQKSFEELEKSINIMNNIIYENYNLKSYIEEIINDSSK